MDIGAISIRYARALLKAATAEGLEDKVYQDMMTLAKSYLEVDQLRQTVENPMLSKEKKEGNNHAAVPRLRFHNASYVKMEVRLVCEESS